MDHLPIDHASALIKPTDKMAHQLAAMDDELRKALHGYQAVRMALTEVAGYLQELDVWRIEMKNIFSEHHAAMAKIEAEPAQSRLPDSQQSSIRLT